MPRNLLPRSGDFHLHINGIFLILMSCTVLIFYREGHMEHGFIRHITLGQWSQDWSRVTSIVTCVITIVVTSFVTSFVTYLVMIKTMRPR